MHILNSLSEKYIYSDKSPYGKIAFMITPLPLTPWVLISRSRCLQPTHWRDIAEMQNLGSIQKTKI